MFQALRYPSRPLQIQSLLWMATAQWPARALGMASSKTSIEGVSHVMVSRLREARLLVHFHSFSWVATSSMTRGTHPPKMNMRLLMRVAEWRERGSGVGPLMIGFDHVIESMCRIHRSPNL